MQETYLCWLLDDNGVYANAFSPDPMARSWRYPIQLVWLNIFKCRGKLRIVAGFSGPGPSILTLSEINGVVRFFGQEFESEVTFSSDPQTTIFEFYQPLKSGEPFHLGSINFAKRLFKFLQARETSLKLRLIRQFEVVQRTWVKFGTWMLLEDYIKQKVDLTY